MINDVKTERDDLISLCDSIVDSSPLLKLQKLEQQLGKDLYDTKDFEKKESVFLESMEAITQLIETENFYPENTLLYLEKRNIEINEKYIPASMEEYRRAFESVKKQLSLKMPNIIVLDKIGKAK